MKAWGNQEIKCSKQESGKQADVKSVITNIDCVKTINKHQSDLSMYLNKSQIVRDWWQFLILAVSYTQGLFHNVNQNVSPLMFLIGSHASHGKTTLWH